MLQIEKMMLRQIKEVAYSLSRLERNESQDSDTVLSISHAASHLWVKQLS